MPAGTFPHKLNIWESNLAAMARVGEPRASTGPSQPRDERWNQFASVGLKYEIQLTAEAYTLIQGAPMLKAVMQEKVRDLVKSFSGPELTPIAKRAQSPIIATTQANNVLKAHQADVDRIVGALLDRHAEMNKAWGDYYKKQRRDLIFCAVGITLTLASTALAVPTGGASIAMSIVGGARVLAQTVAKVAECLRDVDDQMKRIDNSIHTLLAAYQKSVHLGRGVQAASAIGEAIGLLPLVEVAPFINRQLIPSMGKIKGDMEVLKGKCGHLYTLANRFASELFALIDQIDDWKKANPGVDPKTMPGLDKLEKRIARLLDGSKRENKLLDATEKAFRFSANFTVSSAYAKYQQGMDGYTVFDTLMGQINAIEKHPRAIEIISNVVKILGNLAFAGGAYGTGVEVDSAVKIAGLTSTIINDSQGTIKDFVEFVQMAKGPGADSSAPAAARFEATVEVIRLPPPVPKRAPNVVASLPPARTPPPVPSTVGRGALSGGPPTRTPPPVPSTAGRGPLSSPAPNRAPPPIPTAANRGSPPAPNRASPPIPGTANRTPLGAAPPRPGRP
ncbi:hypothetical protein [Sphingomonas sp. Y38-1Y]|uniref:hypothetical protein n=1 Tax=Sphingomonas sp. Y38-1Y TaxID=3078265 RepID=UPI0028E27D30|nr:hypothetical protein [Sphingomonas sp. Y38-1Y]